MEMADAVVINKADGDNIAKANMARMEYQKALHLFPSAYSGWEPKVTTCSALENKGIKELWKIIDDYHNYTKNNGYFYDKRTDQALARMHYEIKEQLFSDFYRNKKVGNKLKTIESHIANNTISSYIAARELIDLYYASLNKTD